MKGKDQGTGGQSMPTSKQMRNTIKKKQAKIAQLNGSVKKKRQELKNLSDQITKLIEKKIIFPHSSERGNYFYPNGDDQQLKQLYQERDKIQKEADQIKQKIASIRAAEEPEVVEEVLKKRSMLAKLQKQYNKQMNEKKLMEQEMEKNKGRLYELKISPCLREIEETQAQLEGIKKEIKQIQKNNYEMMNQDIQNNMFIFEVKGKIQKEESPLPPDLQPVDKNHIDTLIKDIQDILDERRLLDRSHVASVQQLEKEIQMMLKSNNEISARIRIIKNNIMQKDLEERRVKTLKHKSTANINKRKAESPHEQFSQYKSQVVEQQEPQLDISKNLIEQPKLNQILIGSWKHENYIKDDIADDATIQKAISIKFRIKNQKVTGIGATYIDHMGVEVFGRGNIWKNKSNDAQQEININLEEVKELHYNGDNQVGMIWIMTSGKQVKIGVMGEHIEKLSFQQNNIRSAEFCLEENYSNVLGIRLGIEAITLKKKIKAPIKSYSVSEVGLKKRKVVLRSSNNKLGKLPQIDHRLMLNRKKKMV